MPHTTLSLCAYKDVGGGAVAEWFKALLWREKINENPKKIPGSPPGLGNLLKNKDLYVHHPIGKTAKGPKFTGTSPKLDLSPFEFESISAGLLDAKVLESKFSLEINF